MSREFNQRLDFSKLGSSEADPSRFTAEEVKASENEVGREEIAAEELLGTKVKDSFTQNPYRDRLFGELGEIERRGNPGAFSARVEALLSRYRDEHKDVAQRARETQNLPRAELQGLRLAAVHLREVVNWLDAYRAMQVADVRGLAREIVNDEDFKEREVALLDGLVELADHKKNDCAEYVWVVWQKFSERTWSMARKTDEPLRRVADVLEALVLSWVSESGSALSVPEREQAAADVRAVVQEGLFGPTKQ
jgi:hypothetical protein